MIEVEDLNVVFGRGRDAVHAVRQVSFRVAEGASFGCVGESGSGKTVLVRTLLGLLPSTAPVGEDARVLFDGNPPDIRSEKALRRVRGRHISLVFQDPMHPPHPVMTVGAHNMASVSYHRALRLGPDPAPARAPEGWARRRSRPPNRRAAGCS